jgi:hypothetical protein
VIQQIIASIITFILCFVLQNQLEIVGNCLGFSGILAWIIPSFLLILSVWKLIAREWNLGDALALMVVSAIVMIYYTKDISKIIGEIAKVGLGIGSGIVIGYLIKGDD